MSDDEEPEPEPKPDEASIARFERVREGWLERLKEQYAEQWNPLYVWEAIVICNFANLPKRTMPDWCLGYIVSVASSMRQLASLQDAKNYPWRDDDELVEAHQARMEAWSARRITPAQALAQLPWIMDITRQGWNAFKACQSERTDEIAAFAEMEARHTGQADRQERLRRTRNVTPETLRRRAARWRRSVNLDNKTK